MGVWKEGEQADGTASNVCTSPSSPQTKAGSRRGPGKTEARRLRLLWLCLVTSSLFHLPPSVYTLRVSTLLSDTSWLHWRVGAGGSVFCSRSKR